MGIESVRHPNPTAWGYEVSPMAAAHIGSGIGRGITSTTIILPTPQAGQHLRDSVAVLVS